MEKTMKYFCLGLFVFLLLSCETEPEDNTLYHQFKRDGDYIVFYSEAADKPFQMNFDTNSFRTGITLEDIGSVKILVKSLSDNQGRFGLRIGSANIYTGMYIYFNGTAVRMYGFAGNDPLYGSMVDIGWSVPTPINIENGSENELSIDYDFPNKTFSYYVNDELVLTENFKDLDFTNIGRSLYFTMNYDFSSLPTKEEPYCTGFKVIFPKIFP